MIGGQPRRLRLDQCEASLTIRARFGPRAAFDYLVLQKLMNFAEAAERHPEFARELPAFVVAVRGSFAMSELRAQFARLERELAQPHLDPVTARPNFEHDGFIVPPEVVAHQETRFATIKQLLLTDQLGIS